MKKEDNMRTLNEAKPIIIVGGELTIESWKQLCKDIEEEQKKKHSQPIEFRFPKVVVDVMNAATELNNKLNK